MSVDTLHIAASLAFGGFRLSLDEALPLDGVTAVFGPSGSGKTTLLRLIAGFDKPDQGRIAFGDQIWCERPQGGGAQSFVPPHQRRVGFLFQDARLFPHLSVRGNLDYADKRSREDGARLSYDDIVDATDVTVLFDRKPATLSGGERQRVALARTLLTRPDILLFDEPLSALDRSRKTELAPFLDALPSRFGLPVIYVSHDVDEVSRIADRVLYLEDGRVRSFGPTEEILSAYGLEAGRNPYEEGSVLEGIVAGHDPALSMAEIRIGDDPIWLPLSPALKTVDPIRLKVSARDVAISLQRPAGLSIQNILTGTIKSVDTQADGAFCDILLDVTGQSLKARITRKALQSLSLEPGQVVYALVKSASFQR